MLASITIPVYNQRPHLLREAVASALCQTEPVEVVVIDDGCDAEHAPRNILTTLLDKIRLVEHGTNRGIAAALNTGIKAASAPWWCWLSSDDVLFPDKVRVQKAHLDSVGGLCGFHSYFRRDVTTDLVNLSSTPLWTCRIKQNRALFSDCWINGSTVMIHQRVLDEVGPFDESYRYGQDWEMWCRIGVGHRWHAVPCGLCTGDHPQPGCPRCHGSKTWPLGARTIGGNLTELIEHDAEKRQLRDAENLRIVRQYARMRRRA